MPFCYPCGRASTCFSHQLLHLVGLDSSHFADLLDARGIGMIELFEPAPVVIHGESRGRAATKSGPPLLPSRRNCGHQDSSAPFSPTGAHQLGQILHLGVLPEAAEVPVQPETGGADHVDVVTLGLSDSKRSSAQRQRERNHPDGGAEFGERNRARGGSLC
jgi:hypothetical protein